MSLNLPFSTFPAFCDKQVMRSQKKRFKCAGLPARNMAKACKKTGRQVRLEILLNYVLHRGKE